MFKENLDTAAALAILQRMLRCGKGTLAVAGNKDKRGVTSQHVTAYQARCQPIASIAPQVPSRLKPGNGILAQNPIFTDTVAAYCRCSCFRMHSVCINSSTF